MHTKSIDKTTDHSHSRFLILILMTLTEKKNILSKTPQIRTNFKKKKLQTEVRLKNSEWNFLMLFLKSTKLFIHQKKKLFECFPQIVQDLVWTITAPPLTQVGDVTLSNLIFVHQ